MVHAAGMEQQSSGRRLNVDLIKLNSCRADRLYKISNKNLLSVREGETYITFKLLYEIIQVLEEEGETC